MARNVIVLKGRGHCKEVMAEASTVLLPGMAVQRNAAGELIVGNSAVDGERGTWLIVIEDANLSMTTLTAYAAGARVRVYCPVAGDEIQVLADETADTLVVGDKLICDVSEGNFIETTGAVESEGFTILETPGALTTDTLVLVECTGR